MYEAYTGYKVEFFDYGLNFNHLCINSLILQGPIAEFVACL